MKKLLEVTDRRVRRTQVLSMAACGALGGLGAGLLPDGGFPAWAGWAMIAAALGLLALVAGVRQRWDVEYLGHTVRFENSAVTAERMYFDGGLVARGGLGVRMEMRAPIRVGEGAGSEIVALSEARVLSFRLRLFVEAPDDAPEPAGGATLVAAPPAAPARVATDSAVLGGMVVAKQAVEFAAAIIGLLGGLSALVGWLS